MKKHIILNEIRIPKVSLLIIVFLFCFMLSGCNGDKKANKDTEDSNVAVSDMENGNAVEETDLEEEQIKNTNQESEEEGTTEDEQQDSQKADGEVEGANSSLLNDSDDVTDTDEILESENNEEEADEDLKQLSCLDLSENIHTVFTGMINKSRIILDLFREKNKITMSFVGVDYLEEQRVTGKIDETKIVAKSEDNTIVFTLECSNENEIVGYCYIDGMKQEVLLSVAYTTGGDSVSDRYSMGDSEEVEKITQLILDSVTNHDIKMLSSMISYPLVVNGQKPMVIHDVADVEESSIFTKKLKSTLKKSFNRYMYSNEEGIRIGDEDYNIWFTLNEEKDWVITAVNN